MQITADKNSNETFMQQESDQAEVEVIHEWNYKKYDI